MMDNTCVQIDDCKSQKIPIFYPYLLFLDGLMLPYFTIKQEPSSFNVAKGLNLSSLEHQAISNTL
jgi:hypothetical protein